MVAVSSTSEITLSFDTISAAQLANGGTSEYLIVAGQVYRYTTGAGDFTTADSRVYKLDHFDAASKASLRTQMSAVGFKDSRADLVTDIAGAVVFADKAIMCAGDQCWIKDGGSGISDMPGWSPFGQVNLLHFGSNTTPGTTDMSAAMTAMATYMDAQTVNGHLPFGKILFGTTVSLTKDGIGIYGKGRGNVSNLTPATDAPTTVIYSGTGAPFRLTNDNQELLDFRLMSDSGRAARAFDIDQPGVRIEPLDEANARADGCRVNLRIDEQPGDGVLSVGPCIRLDISHLVCYQNKGFGWRADAGDHPDLTRTHTGYPGLMGCTGMTFGYNGGHSFAISGPHADQQSEMGIRIKLSQVDSFGNGTNTSIMYASGDGNHYDMWVFAEQFTLESSAPCGMSSTSLTKEVLGGICVGGRGIELINNRYVETKQPIYWMHDAAQPNEGLTVDRVRVINDTLTHANLVAIEDETSQGLRITYTWDDNFTRPYALTFPNGSVTGPNFGPVTHAPFTVAAGAVATIGAPNTGGFVDVSAAIFTGGVEYPASQFSGKIFYDVGTSLQSADLITSGISGNLDAVNTDVTGTTGTSGNATLGVQSGVVKIENRHTDDLKIRLAFT
ncbi:MAG: hypothetical protein ACPG4X_18620 [Pikeienuella sp.]